MRNTTRQRWRSHELKLEVAGVRAPPKEVADGAVTQHHGFPGPWPLLFSRTQTRGLQIRRKVDCAIVRSFCGMHCFSDRVPPSVKWQTSLRSSVEAG